MEKNLDFYLNISYPIEIEKIAPDEGGGILASIPMLGKHAFLGDGETIEEALANLEEIKTYLFQKYLNQGIPIPLYS
ncbi:toxin-antitoxin system, antitoxin component, HicB family [Candidatus Moduliflexus flocculans]|uniref:Toxin-antitoxin system, antitoxin component, HicB family n=1 Tax=Candidatus Moduliflexus flocculans TaxID=1499966 RepID=A0A081BRU7_9BACT|nr:toxin-antitoxin system, antitoxin component, HicB family [Candidatus Moduliflexus flocculans]